MDVTYNEVARIDSINVVLAITTTKRWEVHHMDVKSEFLHGDLEEEIYMRQHEGYNEDSSLVWKMRKSLYGIKQAPRAWYAKMDSLLMSHKFERCGSDLSTCNRKDASYC